jgi:hydroxymethylglutaryl-CoA reductase
MSSNKSSRLKGFFKLNRGARIDLLRDFASLPVDQARVLGHDGALSFELADLFIENAVGSYPLPLGVATNFKVNGVDYVVPMAVEESSVVAAASNAARWVYESGGFTAQIVSSLMIGQIQILDIEPSGFESAKAILLSNASELIRIANAVHPRLLMRGGGAKEIEVKLFPQAEVPFMVLHIALDTRDAMGANLVNTVCERLAIEVERLLPKSRVGLKILSNLADRKLFRAQCRVRSEFLKPKDVDSNLSGPQIAKRIHEAFVFADSDPYRATTHNKGIMNGIDPVVIATGNDWRAVEAGCHAFAARTGRYRSLSRWTVAQDGDLEGEITVPLQLGTVGGVTRLHPMAKLSLELLGSPDAATLGKVIACAGLASNLAALRALTTTGIQRGHMKLHAKNLALAAGAKGSEVESVSNWMVSERRVSVQAAEEALSKLRAGDKAIESVDSADGVEASDKNNQSGFLKA